VIGLDTNVVIRYLTQDDAKQAAKANKLIEEQLSLQSPGFITAITMVEIVWVLESCYKQNRDDISKVLYSLLTTKQLVIESADKVYLALRRYGNASADFSDALIAIVAEQEGCERVVTFDKQAVKVGMELI